METALTINEVFSQVKQLAKEDQSTLLQRVANLLKRKKATKAASVQLTFLTGLGSEIWRS